MKRHQTREIKIGDVRIGGNNPIAIQSMCNTHTQDVDATVRQILELEQAGCEIIRVTVPDEEAASAVKKIKEQIHIPLVADIHFDYRLAIASIENGADKIRINPGNIGSDENVKKVADACKKNNIPFTEFEKENPYLLHGKIGAFIAKDKFDIKDEDILNSITWHTTGRPNMSLLEKIIFVADYIEPSRYKMPRLKELRKMAFVDIDKCLMHVHKKKIVH